MRFLEPRVADFMRVFFFPLMKIEYFLWFDQDC